MITVTRSIEVERINKNIWGVPELNTYEAEPSRVDGYGAADLFANPSISEVLNLFNKLILYKRLSELDRE